MRWAVAVVVATLVVYGWGIFFWAASGMTQKAVLAVEDHDAVSEFFKEQFPENGLYLIPGVVEDREVLTERSLQGPVAMVHMLAVNGRPVLDPGTLYSGFCHIMLTCIFLSFLLGLAGRGLPTWFYRVRFYIFVGFLVAFYSKIGDAVWWQLSWPWQLTSALYDWVAIALAGLVISTIVPVRVKTEAEKQSVL